MGILLAIAVSRPANALDLSISDVSLSSSTISREIAVRPGEGFRYWANTNKVGSEFWTGTTLRFILSSDSTITFMDYTFATIGLSYLGMGGSLPVFSAPVFVDVTAPATSGRFFLGACIDPVFPELVYWNNCGAINDQIAVTVSDLPPNLVVGTVEATLSTYGSPSVVLTKSGFWEVGRLSDPWIEAVVSNSGTGIALATTVALYRSTDRIFSSTQDTVVAIESVPRLSPGEYVQLTFPDISLPDRVGTYYYSVYVRQNTIESKTSDNWSPSAEVVEVIMQNPANLAATSFQINDSASLYVVPSSEDLTYSVTVTNIGAGRSSPVPDTRHRIYHRGPGDSKYIPTAHSLGDIGSLAPSGTQTLSGTIPVPVVLGEHRFAYGISADCFGSDPCANNVTEFVSVWVVSELPDLELIEVMINGSVGSAIQVLPSSTLRFTASARNTASPVAPVPATHQLILVKPDGVGGVTAAARGDNVERPFASGTVHATELTVVAERTVGEYQYWVCVVTEISDANYTDNCQAVTVSVVRQLRAPATIVLSLGNNQVSESSSSTGIAITASLPAEGGTRSAPTVVAISVTGGTATVGVDFEAVTPVNLVIPAGRLSGSVVVTLTIIGDNIVEPDETIRVTGLAHGDTVVPTAVTVADDDVSPRSIVLRASPENIHENQGMQTVTLSASYPAGSAVLSTGVSVNISVRGIGGQTGNPIQPVSNFTVTIAALESSTAHNIRLTPVDNDVANVGATVTFSGSAAGFTVTPARVTIENDDLAPPSRVRAVGQEKAIALSWMPPQIASTTPVATYVVETRSADGRSWAPLATVLGDSVLSHRHVGLADGQTVSYRLFSNGGGRTSAPSDTISATTQIFEPSPPLFVTAVGSRNRVVLKWERPAHDGGGAVTGYRIESSLDSSSWRIVTTVPTDVGGKFTHRDLPDSERIYYRVAAVNVAGIGAVSKIASAFTSAPYTAALVADINLDSRVTSDDAMVLYFAFTQRRLLGDGLRGGQPSNRRALLMEHVGDLVEPDDQDFRQLLSSAQDFSSLPKHSQLDVNQSGEVDAADALIVYYALAHRELLGDGRSGGFATYRNIMLSGLVRRGHERPDDVALRAVLRRVNDLRDATYTDD